MVSLFRGIVPLDNRKTFWIYIPSQQTNESSRQYHYRKWHGKKKIAIKAVVASVYI